MTLPDTCDQCDEPSDLVPWNDSMVCEDCASCMLDDMNAGYNRFGYDTLEEREL